MKDTKSVVLNEPSVIAIREDYRGNEVIAVGSKAKAMLGKTPESIRAIRPMAGGVISDFENALAMLKHFIKTAQKNSSKVKPRIVICLPYGVTPVEKRAVLESAKQAGGRETYLIEEPMAAAIGAGLPVSKPNGNMVVDIGGGTTEVAVISLGGIVYSKSVRVAGDSFDQDIINYVKKKHSLLIGEGMAEKVKISIGSAYPLDEVTYFQVKGRDLITSGPKTIEVNSDEIRESLTDSIYEIIETIKICLEKTPPELASDIVDNGIVLTGGGALLANLDILIRDKTGLPVTLEEDPLTCVVRGCGMLLDSIPLLKQLSL
jgi:rod shape-determining protein MreB